MTDPLRLNIKCLSVEDLINGDISDEGCSTVAFRIVGFDDITNKSEIKSKGNPEWNEELALKLDDIANNQLQITVSLKIGDSNEILRGTTIQIRDLDPGSVITETYKLYKLNKHGRSIQNKQDGKINLVLQVAKESETPFSENKLDLPIYVSKINIIDVSFNDDLDIYKDTFFTLTWNDEKELKKSNTKLNTTNPKWNQSFCNYHTNIEPASVIHVSLYTFDVLPSLISTLDINLSNKEQDTLYEFSQYMEAKNPEYSNMILINYNFQIIKYGDSTFDEDQNYQKLKSEEEYPLYMRIYKAVNSPKENVYVKLFVDSSEEYAQTKLSKCSSNPVWNDEIQWSPCFADSIIKLELWSREGGIDEKIDSLKLKMKNYPVGIPHSNTFSFKTNENCKIKLSFHVIKSYQKPFVRVEPDAEVKELKVANAELTCKIKSKDIKLKEMDSQITQEQQKYADLVKKTKKRHHKKTKKEVPVEEQDTK